MTRIKKNGNTTKTGGIVDANRIEILKVKQSAKQPRIV